MNFVKSITCLGFIFIGVVLRSSEQSTQVVALSILRKNPPLYIEKAQRNSSPYFKYYPQFVKSSQDDTVRVRTVSWPDDQLVQSRTPISRPSILKITTEGLPGQEIVSDHCLAKSGLVKDIHFVQTFYEQKKEQQVSFWGSFFCCYQLNQVLPVAPGVIPPDQRYYQSPR
jgi:hypothetical protein